MSKPAVPLGFAPENTIHESFAQAFLAALSDEMSLALGKPLPPTDASRYKFPVGTIAIGDAGAYNARLMAAAILANTDSALGQRLEDWRQALSRSVAERPTEGKSVG